MNEPLFMLMKQSYDRMLDEATKEVKNHQKISQYALEVADYAKQISERSKKELYKDLRSALKRKDDM